jgi:hypothetical protein
VTPDQKSIDHDLANEPVCPWCGHVMRDAWELALEDCESAEEECADCERTFVVKVYRFARYSTTKREGQDA